MGGAGGGGGGGGPAKTAYDIDFPRTVAEVRVLAAPATSAMMRT